VRAFVEVRPGLYYDSVTLMAVSRDVGAVDGVTSALVAMATELNLGVLADLGFAPVEAGPDDLLVAVRARDDAALDAARSAVEGALAGGEAVAPRGWEAPQPRTVEAAARRVQADLALISVPGQHAFVEARDALRAGLDVMIFSDNVPITQEVALKEEGARRGLLVMGPDCGTALVDGVGLGFMNAVKPGPVGIVAASGTGAQQVACLLDEAGIGVSAILGVGGRDLSEEVGGSATLQALARLEADPATERIIVISKTPAPAVADRVRAAAADYTTPVTVGFVGPGQPDLTEIAGVSEPRWWLAPEQRGYHPGVIRGLFAGGTLAQEAAAIVPRAAVVDFGDDRYTQGRPHPMIDQRARLEAIAAIGGEDVLLLDVVLGYGAHPDPAAELAPAIASAVGRGAAAVVSLCGTASDLQGRDRQVAALVAAGASVHLSNAHAARKAAELGSRS
jgi:FdrA protein